MKLSDQFDRLAQAINEDGGFSHKVAGPGAGSDAKNSYMVGQGGHDFPPGEITGGQLRDFAVQNYDRLSPPDMYLGGWRSPAPVRASVEPSRAYPRGERGSRTKAKLDAASTNQQAIGVIGEKYEGDLDNPNYKEGAGHTKHALTTKDAAWAFPESTGPKAPSSKRTKIRR